MSEVIEEGFLFDVFIWNPDKIPFAEREEMRKRAIELGVATPNKCGKVVMKDNWKNVFGGINPLFMAWGKKHHYLIVLFVCEEGNRKTIAMIDSSTGEINYGSNHVFQQEAKRIINHLTAIL